MTCKPPTTSDASSLSREPCQPANPAWSYDLLRQALSAVNEAHSFSDAAERIFALLQEYVGCDAIGIRIQAGEDYPYTLTVGFPKHFFPRENTLLCRDSCGELCRDDFGRPLLKCLCGMVLKGQIADGFPPLTPAGTLCINDLRSFFATLTNGHETVKPDNACPSAGFLSLALVPMHCGHEIVGLFHLCYKASDSFSPQVIQTLEHLALILGGSFWRLREMQRMQEDQHKYRELVEGLNEIIYCVDLSGIITYISPVVQSVLGYSAQELIGRPFCDYFASESGSEAFWERAIRSTEPEYEVTIRHKSGEPVWMLVSNLPTFDNGLVTGIRGIMLDISKRKIAEQEYCCLFNEMLDAFALHELIFDEQGHPVDYRFLLVNPAFERMTGLQAGSVIGKRVLEVMPKVETFWIEIYAKVVLTGRSVVFEQYSAPLRKFFKISAFPHGKNQFACIFNDITAQVNAEKELRISEALHKSFLDTMPIPVFCKDVQGRYTRVNPSLCEFFHRPAEFFVGKSAIDIAPPDLAQVYEEKDRELIASRTPQIYESSIVDFIGGVHDVIFHKAVLLDDAGNVNGVIGAIMDITARKRTAKALSESEERMKLALQGGDLGMWDWNIVTGEISINRRWAEMLGYDISEIKPHISSWEQLTHPDDYPRARNIFEQHLRGKTSGFEAEIRMRHKNGGWVWIIDKGRVIKRNSDGEPLRACGTHLDITERKNLELEASLRREQLIHADKLSTIGTLVACIMHEINNPVGVLSLNIPTLESVWQQLQPVMDEVAATRPDLRIGMTTYEKTRRHIPQMFEGITGSCERIRRIIKSLKDFARPDQVETSAELEINRLVTGAVQFLDHHLRKSTRNFSLQLDENLPRLPRGYPGRIEQVIINVLMNATQALSSPEQAIRVRTGFNPDCACLFVQVEDEGCGIPPENMASVSTPFFTTKRSTGGSGLGLSICNTILKEHGGRFEISSSVGKGTTIRILLPMAGTGQLPQTR